MSTKRRCCFHSCLFAERRAVKCLLVGSNVVGMGFCGPFLCCFGYVIIVSSGWPLSKSVVVLGKEFLFLFCLGFVCV